MASTCRQPFEPVERCLIGPDQPDVAVFGELPPTTRKSERGPRRTLRRLLVAELFCDGDQGEVPPEQCVIELQPGAVHPRGQQSLRLGPFRLSVSVDEQLS